MKNIDTPSIRLAIIIPEYEQAQLAIEAIEDALCQKDCPPFAVIVGIDGSKGDEIDRICRSYQSREANLLALRQRRNLGLAGNRNSCVNYCLQIFPNLEALTFLDSDDRLHPKALANLYSVMKDNDDNLSPGERVGWVYTDPYQFGGIHGHMRKPKVYKPLWHLLANSNSATSLITIDIFKSGIFFDETMRQGSEDWAFWLSALECHFVGRFSPPPTFGYRRRPESMSSDASINRLGIQQYIRNKFSSLYKRSALLQRERREMPPYAAIVYDKLEDSFTFSDPNSEINQFSYREIVRLLAAQKTDILFGSIKVLVVASTEFLQHLRESGLFSWSLWYCANQANKAHTVISFSPDAFSIQDEWSEEIRKGRDHAVFISLKLFQRRTVLEQVNTSFVSLPKEVVHSTSIKSIDFLQSTLIPYLDQIGYFSAADQQPYVPIWKPDGVDGRSLVSALLRTTSHFPVLAAGINQKNIALVASPGSFKEGNVDLLVRILKSCGMRNDNVVLYCRQQDIANAAYLSVICKAQVFCLPEAWFHSDPRRSKHYLGSSISPWMLSGEKGEPLGVFVSMDIIVNLGVPEISSFMFLLKKMGLRTCAVIDSELRQTRFRSRWRHPKAQAFAQLPFVDNLLAYEHAYDAIGVSSACDRPWLTGRGLPEAKIHCLASLGAMDLRSKYGAEKTSTLTDSSDYAYEWKEFIDAI